VPQQSLIKTPPEAGQGLQVNGRVLSQAHEQIVGILRGRLGQNHGDLLAQPRADASGGISWSTALAGAVTPAAQLPEDERHRLQQRAERITAEIRGLAQQMRSEGPAAQVVAQMLDGAVQTPPGEWLYSVGGKPVLAMWGHAAVGAAAAPVPAGPAMAGAAAPSAPPGVPAPPLPPGPGRPWGRWLLWGLLALLLLALLLWGLKRCSDTPTADAGLAEQIAQAEARNQALQAEIDARRGQGPALQCVPDAPPPAASAPEPEPPASAVLPAASAPEPARPAPAAPASAPAPRQPPVASQPLPAKPPPAPAAPASRPAPPRSEAAPATPTRQACKPRQPGDEPELVMIVDASGSMRQPFGGSPSRLDAAKRAADTMIRGLPADVDVGLVDFTACGQVRRDKFYSAPQRGALIGEINGLSAKQGTPLADAIRRAGTVASDSADSVIVIVSDGGDSCGGDPCAVARSVRAAKPNVTINVIDLSVTPADRQVLQCIATAGGGRVLSPGDPLDMSRKMKEAAGAANCTP